jgi:predicted RecB family nuclease
MSEETLTTINHSARKHALCSASSADRWLECPGSVGLSMTVPEPPTSSYALEGTKAHEFSESILHQWIKDNYVLEDDFLRQKREEGGEMFDYVMQYVYACVEEAMRFDTTPTVRIEQKLTFSKDMEMFGTADFIATGTMDGKSTGVIVDLKYGKGKKVKTEGNPQLAYYAVALRSCSKKKLEQVKVRIVQPRIEDASTSITFSKEDLDAWNQKLTLGAEQALWMAGKMKTPAYKMGSWCWFCAAKSVCPEMGKKLNENLAEQFPDDF